MASKRRLRRRSCEGKKPYPNKIAADNACKKLLRNKGERCNAYPCKFSNHWHVGHPLRKSRTSYNERVLGGYINGKY